MGHRRYSNFKVVASETGFRLMLVDLKNNLCAVGKANILVISCTFEES